MRPHVVDAGRISRFQRDDRRLDLRLCWAMTARLARPTGDKELKKTAVERA
jgi:hypothetical protein